MGNIPKLPFRPYYPCIGVLPPGVADSVPPPTLFLFFFFLGISAGVAVCAVARLK
jgi:hypothetical protein